MVHKNGSLRTGLQIIYSLYLFLGPLQCKYLLLPTSPPDRGPLQCLLHKDRWRPLNCESKQIFPTLRWCCQVFCHRNVKISLQAVNLKPTSFHMSIKLSAGIFYTSISIELNLKKQELDYLLEKNQVTFSYDVTDFVSFTFRDWFLSDIAELQMLFFFSLVLSLCSSMWSTMIASFWVIIGPLRKKRGAKEGRMRTGASKWSFTLIDQDDKLERLWGA